MQDRACSIRAEIQVPPASFPALAQAFKVLISSSSLSAMACTSAWVGGLETAQTRMARR